tara:strand:+ start:219 stop:554 length:336 start_codon:yes stop_codon:yes gene_type:complete
MMIISKEEKDLLLGFLNSRLEAIHLDNALVEKLHAKISKLGGQTDWSRVGRWDIRMNENESEELDIKVYLDGEDEFSGSFAMQHLEYSTDEGSVYGPVCLEAKYPLWEKTK